jgi:arginase
MVFINPQWQGSGFTDDLKFGAETFKSFFKDLDTTVIPLSTKELTTIENIKCFEPILEQTMLFKNIIADKKLKKISTIGGDCGIEIIPISYLNKIYQEDICIVWIDAHADLNTPESSPSKTFHGMPLRTLLGEGNKKIKDLLFSIIKPKQVCYVGLRDLDQPESEYILSNSITTLEDCQYSNVLDKIKSFNNIYIHLDLDVLDKFEFEFTMFPTTTKGLLVEDVVQLIKKLKSNHNVVGFCITESTATNLEQLDAIKPILDEIEL